MPAACHSILMCSLVVYQNIVESQILHHTMKIFIYHLYTAVQHRVSAQQGHITSEDDPRILPLKGGKLKHVILIFFNNIGLLGWPNVSEIRS